MHYNININNNNNNNNNTLRHLNVFCVVFICFMFYRNFCIVGTAVDQCS